MFVSPFFNSFHWGCLFAFISCVFTFKNLYAVLACKLILFCQ